MASESRGEPCNESHSLLWSCFFRAITASKIDLGGIIAVALTAIKGFDPAEKIQRFDQGRNTLIDPCIDFYQNLYVLCHNPLIVMLLPGLHLR